MYTSVIVEDDPMISMINRSFLARDGRFAAPKEFGDGKSALDWLYVHPVDLMILDVYMPNLSGLELLRQLRMHGNDSAAIMVTAANDAKTIDAFLKLGVTDYLVKPFTRQRFDQALNHFCRQRETLAVGKNVNQQQLDALLLQSSGITTPVPKGLSDQTLDLIRDCLSDVPDEGLTSAELAEVAGLSSVTIRRYMQYMTDQGEVARRVNYDTGGRPSILYINANFKGGRN